MAVLRDLSIILLAVAMFAMALVPLAVFGGLVYGLGWLGRHEHLPSWLRLAQAYVTLGRAYVERAMRAVVSPIMAVHSIMATVQGWLRAIAKLGGAR
jgi:hypothetical protein